MGEMYQPYLNPVHIRTLSFSFQKKQLVGQEEKGKWEKVG